MKLAAMSFVSSSRMASLRSCANQRSCCFTGFAPSLTFRLCSITSRGTPGMSEGFQEKISWFAWRKVTSTLSYFVTEPCPDQYRVGRIGRVEHNLLDVLVDAYPRLSCFLHWTLPLLLGGSSGEPDGIPLGFCL